ncbi:4'-phosphopantetheinyl transferase superfamily protein [Lentimicrobium sp. L6]|uniref:4'-phosphopantetheinyl transferase family protein n=1 Tax=Lentimicrobium sp. L6 TaxID=2735916 RepID=UPI00155816E4|nr:4'-phosphopantetheinyl transferase superfamily protein [Lentimicrobium sp. L6]NPD84807.1 4'-phosphopantetheinyl transferase superfamily protein [Lentimicrobium sp. L6]
MNMIYHTNSLLIQEKYSLAELIERMPEAIQQRALRYKFEADGYQFVIGRLLLKYGLMEMGRGDLLDHITYLKNDKPHLEDISFNISHSGNMVVCVLAEQGQIGIDIEQHRQIKLSDFEAFFTPKEWVNINKSTSPLQKFFCYWTRKESIIKALGVNLFYLHQIEIDASNEKFSQNGQRWFLQDLDFGQYYYGCLCTDVMEDMQKVEVAAELLCR